MMNPSMIGADKDDSRPCATTVLAAVAEVLATHGRSPSGPYPRIVNTWVSRTAYLCRVRVDACEANDVVIKILNDTSQAATLVSTLNDLADCVKQRDSIRFSPVPAFGYCEAIGGIVMPFVQGVSLEQILKGEVPGPEFTRDQILEFIERCGRLLAGYHARYRCTSHAATDEAWRDLEVKVKTVLGEQTAARNVLSPSVASRSFGDFHPGHVIVGTDGRLAILDPSADARSLFVARDIACFLDRMVVDVLAPRSVIAAPLRLFAQGELTSTFLRGYEEAVPGALSDGDLLAVDFYLAFKLKTRFRWISDGRWTRLLYYGVPLAYRYRQVMERLRARPVVTSRPS